MDEGKKVACETGGFVALWVAGFLDSSRLRRTELAAMRIWYASIGLAF